MAAGERPDVAARVAPERAAAPGGGAHVLHGAAPARGAGPPAGATTGPNEGAPRCCALKAEGAPLHQDALLNPLRSAGRACRQGMGRLSFLLAGYRRGIGSTASMIARLTEATLGANSARTAPGEGRKLLIRHEHEGIRD